MMAHKSLASIFVVETALHRRMCGCWSSGIDIVLRHSMVLRLAMALLAIDRG